jgi:hypothetical protein
MKSISINKLNLTTPDNWKTEVNGSVTSLFDPDTGVGALQFSYYTVPDINAIDIIKELKEYSSDKYDDVNVEFINGYAYFSTIRSETYWRYWLLKEVNGIVFISYNCNEIDAYKENSTVNGIIHSILF